MTAGEAKSVKAIIGPYSDALFLEIYPVCKAHRNIPKRNDS